MVPHGRGARYRGGIVCVRVYTPCTAERAGEIAAPGSQTIIGTLLVYHMIAR